MPHSVRPSHLTRATATTVAAATTDHAPRPYAYHATGHAPPQQPSLHRNPTAHRGGLPLPIAATVIPVGSYTTDPGGFQVRDLWWSAAEQMQSRSGLGLHF